MAPASSMNATVAASIMVFCSERAGQDAGLSITARGEAAKLYLQEARTTLKVAAELSKDQPISLDGLAWFLSSCQQASLRDPALALELAESAVRKEPENKAYLATLGLAHYRMGHWSEALQAIKKEIRIGKGADTADWFVLAMAYQRLGDKDQAIRCYRRADAQRKKGQEPSEDATKWIASTPRPSPCWAWPTCLPTCSPGRDRSTDARSAEEALDRQMNS